MSREITVFWTPCAVGTPEPFREVPVAWANHPVSGLQGLGKTGVKMDVAHNSLEGNSAESWLLREPEYGPPTHWLNVRPPRGI